MKDNTLTKSPEEQQQLMQENEMLKSELKNLEEFITEVLLEHRQLTALEYMQKLLNDDSTWTETNKLLVSELVKEVKKGNCNDNYIIEIINKLEERIESDEETIKYWKRRTIRGEEDAAIHFKALTKTSKEWNERKLLHWVRFFLELNADKDNLHGIETKSLEKKVSEKTREIEEVSSLYYRVNEIAEKRWERIKKLEKELEAKSELLDKANKKIEEKNKKLKDKDNIIENLTKKLYRVANELPSLSKKTNKFKTLKAKIKAKSQQLTEKTKHVGQELIARIEVKTK